MIFITTISLRKGILSCMACTCLMLSSCTTNENKTDKHELNLNGDVKSLKSISYRAYDRFGEIEKGERSIENESSYDKHLSFNQDGNILVENRYGSDGQLQKKITVEYDERGQKTEENWIDANGKILSKSVYSYDERGNILTIEHFSSNMKLTSKYINVFDNDGNIIEGNLYNEVGKIQDNSKFDAQGNIVLTTWYDRDGIPSYRETFKYDEDGNCLEDHRKFEDGTFEDIYTYVYDYKGDCTEMEIIDPIKNRTISYSYSHDEFGNVKESVISESGATLAEKITHLFEYSYDENDNWISRVHYLNGRADYLIERDIEYWE